MPVPVASATTAMSRTKAMRTGDPAVVQATANSSCRTSFALSESRCSAACMVAANSTKSAADSAR